MADHHQHHHPADEASEAAMAELLDLDAEVLHSYLSGVTAWILDLASGTGAGTFALLQRFEGAEVIAMDISAPLLDHLTGRARVLGLADRVRTIPADLDAAWPALDPVDLAWASKSLHHV